MPRRMDPEDDWEEESDSDEDDFDGSDDAEEEPTVPCPYCHKPIHEDAQRCPYCENYISEEDAPPRRKPWWIIIGALAVFYIVYRWIVG
jgi:predicted nucleic acid-binding Zn ribbon protein